MNNPLSQIWHQGELAIQRLAGTKQAMAEIGPKYIREFMPQQHRDFFQSLSMIFIGYNDYCKQTRASVLFGEPGFIHSPTENELVINTQYSMGDFMRESLNLGERIGLLGIEFESKRRNRLNAIIMDINQKTIQLKVLQSYGNCPKYIQSKTLKANRDYGDFSINTHLQLNHTDRQLISKADTFFIASSFDDGQQLNSRGVDISHRGGSAGFVSITPQGQLLVDDYVGNGFFNTLGNLYKNPLASLLFCDWLSGHALHIRVTSQILWHEDAQQHIAVTSDKNPKTTKAKRTLCFTPISVERLTNGLAQLQIAY
ncbi:pyridoxamine 5'-phosphate oxidase family protein [Paraglaciecola hydrolytica]|uniref:Uncharacterized protein n=1 Tax=Paraglaciecola hydrolytica TaxID=1799789 RepID=A0A148KNJ9_9ALTE|nr:pyridoxamine 5'-phosphate oxidase family protein [Paraglaciecola hydrolytica]KXI27877.1 hypothetical protein AX660_20395 [Paraglaciecola hydrolytica]